MDVINSIGNHGIVQVSAGVDRQGNGVPGGLNAQNTPARIQRRTGREQRADIDRIARVERADAEEIAGTIRQRQRTGDPRLG